MVKSMLFLHMRTEPKDTYRTFSVQISVQFHH